MVKNENRPGLVVLGCSECAVGMCSPPVDVFAKWALPDLLCCDFLSEKKLLLSACEQKSKLGWRREMWQWELRGQHTNQLFTRP